MPTINLKDKIIPKGSKVVVEIEPGVPAGTEFSGVTVPDDGYLFNISYFRLTVPDGVEANVIVETDSGEFPLLANNVTNDTVYIDASDFYGLEYLKSFTLYVKVLTDTTSHLIVELEYSGRQVVPYL